jgi:hypothetical protein
MDVIIDEISVKIFVRYRQVFSCGFKRQMIDNSLKNTVFSRGLACLI